MGDDVIVGNDGKTRCEWAGTDDTPSRRYHDRVWGARTANESAMFEALTLGVFEAGLNWRMVWGKRDALRKAFRDFDVNQVASMTKRDVDRLMKDPEIIRNRRKIEATIANARATKATSGGLAALTKSIDSGQSGPPKSIADIPDSTAQAKAFSEKLKTLGYQFVGPTSAYSFMQHVGMVNDHIEGCFRARGHERRATNRARSRA
jgi:DNA-3-methyladenine glycosylase I